ncbi:MAG: PorP/SprF family type IX secretion system membrane protein [Saprospiraceae bacterium]|nr:PorP/SprF family type IX secretion system membrane protein [Saprospiraceae bacterium]
MRLNRFLLVLALAIPLSMAAQDIHFTQFQNVPLSVNAAQTGLFEGTFRISGLYRSQWFGSGNGTVKNGYQTPVIHVDVPIKGFRKQDWIGIGLNLHQDRTGVAALTNSLAGIAAAYHIGFDKKGANILSVGAQYGFVSRRIDADKLRFADGIIRNQTSVDVTNIDAQGKTYSDISFGVNLRSVIDAKKKNVLNLGASVEHLISPEYNLVKTTISKLPRRFNLYGVMDLAMTKQISLHPALIFRAANGQTETMAQAMVGFKLDPKKNTIVKGGLGYRLGDAAQVLLGAEFGDIRVGASYDVTTSNLRSNTNIKDGFEIAVGYIGKIFKKPNPPATILCPRY